MDVHPPGQAPGQTMTCDRAKPLLGCAHVLERRRVSEGSGLVSRYGSMLYSELAAIDTSRGLQGRDQASIAFRPAEMYSRIEWLLPSARVSQQELFGFKRMND